MSADDPLLLALAMRLWEQRGQLLTWEHLGADTRGHDVTVSALSRLLEIGFDVRLSPSGVRLVPAADTPCSHELLDELGIPSVCSPVVESTNSIGVMLVKAGAAHGTVVLAEAQVCGRGRHGKSWFSPAGQGLWLSMLLCPTSELPSPGLVSLLVGLCVARVLRRRGADVVLKWANDVMWHGRKICGILVDRVARGNDEAYVAGIGINVHQSEEAFPPDIRAKSVSLDMVVPQEVDRADLVLRVAREILAVWAAAEPEGLRMVPDQWNAESGTVGMPVRVGAGSELFSGTVAGVTGKGELQVLRADDTLRTVASGHIELMV
ncbi:biotin--[acetyl-CoA-carboxylase] ligase [Candidatus Fermentibacteria bacterium]|nr:biotin--[acetyl-CoA-carboxylase] ligase [Candidatus Fermentibacteria bacterium]